MNDVSPAAGQDRVKIFDTTLRDGEQSPGRLDDAGREAAHRPPCSTRWASTSSRPASPSPPRATSRRCASRAGDRERRRLRAGPLRPRRHRPRRRGDCSTRKRERIHTFIATRDIHMAHKLRMTPDQVLERIDSAVRHAEAMTDDVQWSPEDATRTDRDFLVTRCRRRSTRAPRRSTSPTPSAIRRRTSRRGSSAC